MDLEKARKEDYIYTKDDFVSNNRYSDGATLLTVRDKDKKRILNKKDEMEGQRFGVCEPFFYQNYWYILAVRNFNE